MKQWFPHTRKGLAKLAIVAIAIPAGVTILPSVASAAKVGDSCKTKDLFEVDKVVVTNSVTKRKTTQYIRCMVSPGSSLHASKPKLSWQKTTLKQYRYRNFSTKGSVRIDGSSTVYPLMAVLAKYFENTTDGRAQVSIGISGTGGGFEKFCKGETDMSNASRAINSKEIAACNTAGVKYTEILIANDGLAVVVNPKNPLTCITMAQLKTMWQPATGSSGPGSVKTWGAAIPGNTLGDLKLYGAGSDSGTFDSFNTFVHASSTKSRTDYQATENDNVTVKGVASDTRALGYYGLSYAIENAKKNKALQIDKGAGCVAPNAANVQNGSYAMSRPLYVYVKNTSTFKPVIKGMLEMYLDNAKRITDDALFVGLTRDQIGTAFAKISSL